MVAYCGYAIGDCDACEFRTIIKRIVTYLGHAVAKSDTCERVTTIKRILTYRGYAVSDGDRREGVAIIKRPVTYRGYGVAFYLCRDFKFCRRACVACDGDFIIFDRIFHLIIGSCCCCHYRKICNGEHHTNC